ncbi:MAG: hypothetical protein FJ405_16065 [Verrucomicrobia bacterium]|nr:hypothetical protein [Verrucomicrobiota bacterium]
MKNLLTAAAILALTSTLCAAPEKPQYTIKDVMKAIHKGDTSLGKKVAQGQGTKEDFAKMVSYYKSLPLNEPPRGDKASWSAKAAALLHAAEGLHKGEATALESYKKASNCKACHSQHKPE